jgi:hypothetical protein
MSVKTEEPKHYKIAITFSVLDVFNWKKKHGKYFDVSNNQIDRSNRIEANRNREHAIAS